MQQETLRPEQTAPMTQLPPQQEDEIDLVALLMGVLEHWKLIAVTAVLGAVLAALYTIYMITPMYRAKATIYVVSRNDSVINMSDLQLGSALTSDFIKIFDTWEIHEKVISALDLDYSYGQIAGMLSVTNTDGTRMIDLTVTNADPKLAAAIANEYAEVGSQYIAEKMKTDEPTVLSTARVPANPVSPNKSRNIMMGFLAGFVLSAGIVVLRVLLDDTYKSADDIRKYTGLVVLAAVPLAESDKPKDSSPFKRRMQRFVKDIRRRVGGRKA